MVWLFVIFILATGCETAPTEEQLVRNCQNRGGTPSIQGPFKCEIPDGQSQLASRQTPPARFN